MAPPKRTGHAVPRNTAAKGTSHPERPDSKISYGSFRKQSTKSSAACRSATVSVLERASAKGDPAPQSKETDPRTKKGSVPADHGLLWRCPSPAVLREHRRTARKRFPHRLLRAWPNAAAEDGPPHPVLRRLPSKDVPLRTTYHENRRAPAEPIRYRQGAMLPDWSPCHSSNPAISGNRPVPVSGSTRTVHFRSACFSGTGFSSVPASSLGQRATVGWVTREEHVPQKDLPSNAGSQDRKDGFPL